MTRKQLDAVGLMLAEHEVDIEEVHHGDCVGADAQFHELARAKGLISIAHPPTDSKYRAFCKDGTQLAPKPYLERNHDIVNACDVLIVCPKERTEVLRSGTWATYRYGRKQGKKVKLILPW
jgi:hypothetical protein